MAKHTEGPWHVQEARHLAIDTSVYDAHKRLVAATNIYGRPLEEAEANAHLIASAPDYHAACDGPEGPDITRMDWLDALVQHFETVEAYAKQHGYEDDDPSATLHTMVEVKDLSKQLRAAHAKAEGGRG